MLDRMDRKILDILQKDCTMPVAEIGKQIGLSTTPCWRRIQKLEESGVIQRRVALLDAKKVNVGVTVFVSITTSHHTQEWLDQFHEALKDFPEVVEFYRMSGQVDYLLRVVVPDIERYDAFYKRLIARIELSDVSSAFAMEQIKYTTSLPLDYAADQGSSILALEQRDQARRVPAIAAHRLHLGVELIDQRGDGKLGAVPARLVEREREILPHQIDGEAEVESAFDHGLPAVLHLPGLRRALGDRVDHLLDVEAGALGEMQRLGETLNQSADADLVDHLGELA